jgi:hypothetical protein
MGAFETREPKPKSITPGTVPRTPTPKAHFPSHSLGACGAKLHAQIMKEHLKQSKRFT